MPSYIAKKSENPVKPRNRSEAELECVSTIKSYFLSNSERNPRFKRLKNNHSSHGCTREVAEHERAESDSGFSSQIATIDV